MEVPHCLKSMHFISEVQEMQFATSEQDLTFYCLHDAEMEMI